MKLFIFILLASLSGCYQMDVEEYIHRIAYCENVGLIPKIITANYQSPQMRLINPRDIVVDVVCVNKHGQELSIKN